MSERPKTPSTPIFANTAFAFAIVPWLAFSRSIATSIATFSPSIVIFFLGAGNKPVKITLILPILNDTVFLKLALGKGFCNGCCHFSFMMQHFFLVKLQKRIQPCDPILMQLVLYGGEKLFCNRTVHIIVCAALGVYVRDFLIKAPFTGANVTDAL